MKRRVTSRDAARDPFDGMIAATLTDMPSASPPVDFMVSVMGALPKEAPVVLPDPVLELAPPSPWKWVLATLGVLTALTAAALNWSQEILLWIYTIRIEQIARVSEGSFDLFVFADQIRSAIVAADVPVMTIALLAALAVTAWGATSMAAGSRSVQA